ncbi:hypothetical protein [Clostridium merdae]|uniref:hypothetical protein n=1 Tax=Clostridium merdae TaxID=1958780 RepID=UPI000A268F4C|nr:hypothetical protein [Clostridium merdae]
MITNFYEKLKKYCKKPSTWYFILQIFLITVVLTGVIFLLVWLLEMLFNFLALKFDLIITIISISGVVIYMWNTKREEKKAKQIQIQRQQEIQSAEIERAVAENNYAIIRQCLFSVLSEQAERINLVKPSTLSEMNSPSRIIAQNGFMLCQFVAMKQTDEVDLKLVKECLQMRISQKLNAGEFHELSGRNHVYNGRAYPLLYIDDVVNTGGYIQLNVALSNDAFCQYLENKAYVRQQNHVNTSPFPRDVDF